jgi:dUTP pyrophosphatase
MFALLRRFLSNSPLALAAVPKTVLKVKKMYEDSAIPTRGSGRAAGYDVYAYVPDEIFDDGTVIKKEIVIDPRQRKLVGTGLVVIVPKGHYGRVAPRSGLACKKCVDVAAGVIDEDYRGELMVVLVNNGNYPFVVKTGDKIAQLICEKISYPDIEQIEDADETKRGSDGFGSTGY